MTTNDRNRDDAEIEQLLLALDVEARSLSPDVTDSLAVARHRAINSPRAGMARSSSLSRRASNASQHQNEGTHTGSCSSQHGSQSVRWALPGRDFFSSLQFNHPFTTALAGIGIASLTVLMVLSGPATQSTQEDLLAMNSPDGLDTDGLDTADKPTAKEEHSALQAVAFEAESSAHLPLIRSEESLDLVGSVDFLLWLDSQQG